MVEKPHTALIKVCSEKRAGSQVKGVEFTDGATITGQLTVKDQQWIFERWGIKVERPALWMCDLDDATFKKGDRLLIDGTEWTVEAHPQRHEADTETSHATAPLDRRENA